MQLSTLLKWQTRYFLYKLGLIHLFEISQLLIKYFFKRPHEKDYEIFKKLPPQKGLFVDIGANIGQSAASFRIYNKTYKILSFEPNPIQKNMLKILKFFLGKDFEYFIQGFSTKTEKRMLYIPTLRGFPFTQEATLDKKILQDPITIERLYKVTGKKDYKIKEVELSFVPFDSLNLRPDIVKIDVQGAELRVLQGMQETLKNSRPLLMIEIEHQKEEILNFLKTLGYETYLPNKHSQNMFFYFKTSNSPPFFFQPKIPSESTYTEV